jgi:hypothetical protein
MSAVLHGDFKAAYALNRLNVITIPLIAYVYVNEWSRTIKNPSERGAF